MSYKNCKAIIVLRPDEEKFFWCNSVKFSLKYCKLADSFYFSDLKVNSGRVNMLTDIIVLISQCESKAVIGNKVRQYGVDIVY